MTSRASGLLLLVASCSAEAPTWRSASAPPPSSHAIDTTHASEGAPTTNAAVPAGAFDVPDGGCPPASEGASSLCRAAMALPLVPTALPTRLGGAVPLPGGKVHNRSGRDLYAVASRGGGTWEILRIVAGTTIGGDVIGEGPYLTRDVDWVTAVPPVADPGGGFAYDPTTIGVKIYDSGELTVLDRPGGGVRFDMTSGTLRSTIASVGQMNGGSRIVSR